MFSVPKNRYLKDWEIQRKINADYITSINNMNTSIQSLNKRIEYLNNRVDMLRRRVVELEDARTQK